MYFRYLQACIITIFIFLSGYLKRDRGSMKENWRKYAWGLVIPYIVYNALMLPYWGVRYYLQQGEWPDIAALMKPIIGALLLEHSSSFAEPLNGTLWYLPAILFMHLITDLCHRTRHEHLLLMGVCIVSVIGHFLYRYYEPHPNMTPMEILRRFPYFYLGYVVGQLRLLRSDRRWYHDAVLCVSCFSASVLLFYWHVAARPELLLHLAIFYPVNVFFISGFVYASKLLQRWTPQWVVNVSVGTLIIVGLQWMVIGTINYAITHLTGLNANIVYTWAEALILAVFITALHYPIILLAKRYEPLLLGKK